MYRVPAVSRMLADPNLQKLITCPCWKNGRVQLKILYRKKPEKNQAKQAMSKKLGLSPKFVTHTSPNFRDKIFDLN